MRSPGTSGEGGGRTGMPPGSHSAFEDFAGGEAAERIYDAATRSVPDEIRDAIDAYVGERFRDINRFLAYGEPPDDLAEVRDLIRRLDLGISAQAMTSRGTVLYRSERYGGMTRQWVDAETGDIVRHLRYVSTSTSDEVPRGKYAGPVRLQIMVPPGARGINVRRLSSHPDAAGEFEITLPRASEFRVITERKVGVTTDLRVELIV